MILDKLTVRLSLALLTTLAIVLAGGQPMIALLTKINAKQVIRKDGPTSHFIKKETPTMGGGLVITALIVTILLWTDLTNSYIWLLITTLVLFALIGFVDDLLKIWRQNSKGLSSNYKYLSQSVVAVMMILGFVWLTPGDQLLTTTQILFSLPLARPVTIELGWLFFLLSYVVIVGASNAVNLTDGLDGLAIMPCITLSIGLGIVAWMMSSRYLSAYCHMPYLPQVGELVIVCASTIGAGFAFLWFNCYPAQVFMGDVGALSLGAMLALVAIMIRQEWLLFVMSGVLVVETLSVILQVGYYKLTAKRIFLMAPIHHHFELKGWPEAKIITRFWIINFILLFFALTTFILA